MQYTWQKAARSVSGLDAQAIGQEIEALGGRDGVAPADLVEAARNPGSAMHSYFEWDDAKAADAYRVQQARYLLRSIEVVIREEHPPIRAFHAVVVEDGPEGDDDGGDKPRRYVPVSVVAADEALRRQVIEAALAELQGWRKRYAQYRELEQIGAAIDAAMEQVLMPATA